MAKISKELIHGWLKDIGMSPMPIPDPQGEWRYSVCMPANQDQNRLEVFGNRALPRAVIIGSSTMLSPEHRANLGALDADAKRQFVSDLVAALNKDFVEYQLEQDALTGDLVKFQVSAVRFDDGVTLDSFARTLGSVFKAQLAGIQCVQQHLGGATPAGGEFAFRKLGMQ